ncbi:MAG: metalloregulator ArsR/SmtB family transcription factor [Armatimonadetes bacterium]|nr:metalloregulator ArsR/SmtB family transcription factor [Armatimonadota bacterium]
MDLLTTNTELVEHRPVLELSRTEYIAEGFRALGDPHRLKILHLLLTCGEMCVCETVLALEISQSNLSFHLKTLKQAGFIKARKSGRWMYYSLSRPAFEQFLGVFGGVFDLEKWPDRPQCTSCDDTRENSNASN